MEICLLRFTSCVLPASPLISTHPSSSALQVSVVVCCLPCFAYIVFPLRQVLVQTLPIFSQEEVNSYYRLQNL